MIRLAVDAVLAVFSKISGLYTINVLPDAVDNLNDKEAAVDHLDPQCVCLRADLPPRPVVDAPPLGAAERGGPEGIPRSTSDLLIHAAAELIWIYEDRRHPAIVDLLDEMTKRAAELSATEG